MSSVKEYVLKVVAEHPTMGNEELADLVRKELGTQTSAASVSSIKSNARKSGELEAAATVVDLAPRPTETADLPEDNGETEEEIDARLKKRFSTLDRMTKGIIDGVVPALIVSGPPGLGKSYGIEKALEAKKAEDMDFKCDVINGTISAVGLYIALWNMRDNGVLVLDDCDDVFRDETTLNLLKAALDSCDVRKISWRKEAHWLVREGIDQTFEFKGRVVFLSNLDFEEMANSGRQGSQHFKALMDRSLYLNLTMRTLKDYMVRIKQVVLGEKMLDKYGFEEKSVKELLAYVEEHKKRFFHLSLRLIHQIALCRIADPDNWKDDVEMTKMRLQ